MRSQLRALVAELLDGSDQSEGLKRALAGERAVQLDRAESIARGVWVLRPMFELDEGRVARARAAFATVASASDWPAAKQAMRGQPLLSQVPQTTAWAPAGTVKRVGPATRQPIDYTRILGTDVCVTPAANWTIEYDMRNRADRRLTAVAVAVRLYRADHSDQFPPSLDALVPRYLPAVPVDPFSADGKLIRYVIIPGGLPGGGDRPLVYSVGLDGRDDTALVGRLIVPNVPCHSMMKGADRWVDLKRWTPPTSPEQEQAEAAAEAAAGAAAEADAAKANRPNDGR